MENSQYETYHKFLSSQKSARAKKKSHPVVESLWHLKLGANPLPEGGTAFRVWAPFCSRPQLKLFKKDAAEIISMKPEGGGYFYQEVPFARAGMHYVYVLNDEIERPDPVSRFQLDTVHGPSVIADPEFPWTDQEWRNLNFKDLIFYEIHTGTFTAKGTFEAVIQRLPYLKKLGINCLEFMPVAQFPGKRNWGYDGVEIYAVQNTYGGPKSLKKLINACHQAGIAVCLDVVYNHLGPEGNYLDQFGPYFTDKYHTPWGRAFNYDDVDSDPVRRFVIDNALYWITEFHVDALRLDAIHSIFDFSAKHLLEELTEKVKEQGRRIGKEIWVIAESDLNDAKIVRSKEHGGYGLDAQWSDDFHHALHAYVTGEKTGYYEDFGTLKHLAKAVEKTFVLDGIYSKSRRRRHGNSAENISGEHFIICAQNHDQVGNRALGERLGSLVSFQSDKVCAALVLISPYLPLLFMGQEYGETVRFQYFIDHGDPNLVEAVRRGRKKEFTAFGWENVPDPAALETFESSRLNGSLCNQGKHAGMLLLYRDLIVLRKSIGLVRTIGRDKTEVRYHEDAKWLAIRFHAGKSNWALITSFAKQDQVIASPFLDSFREVLNTSWARYGGKLKPVTKVYEKEMPLSAETAMIGKLTGKK